MFYYCITFILKSIISSQCYKPEEFNVQCPVCSKHFNELAKTLPFAHHSQSYLICALSGEPMNEHNPPLVLPNGYVYGQKVSCNVLLSLSERSCVFVVFLLLCTTHANRH